MNDLSTTGSFNEIAPRVSEFRRIIKAMTRRPVVVFGLAIILLLVIIALFAPLISPYDPYEQNIRFALEQPSKSHFLGTDEQGRDVLSRIIYGTQISLLVGLVAVAIAGVIGIILGLVAGYFGGWINIIIMRFIDAILALPPLVLMLAISVVLGSGITNILIAIGFGLMPTYARLMCGQVLTIKENDYIIMLRAIGARNRRIMFRHVLPNTFPPLLVLVTMNLGSAILMEASLSFLGIGINPPTATWGSMVSTGYRYLMTNPALSITPGLAIMLVVLAFSMVGDGLRDSLDPRLRGQI